MNNRSVDDAIDQSSYDEDDKILNVEQGEKGDVSNLSDKEKEHEQVEGNDTENLMDIVK